MHACSPKTASGVFAIFGVIGVRACDRQGREVHRQICFGYVGIAEGISEDAFGNVTAASGATAAIPSSVGTDFRYHGMQLDAVSGLYHVRARTYDARTGRFTSRDPVAGVTGRPETMNPYVLDHGNPHVWRDPSGRFGLIEITIVAAITTTLAAIAIPAYTGYLRRSRALKAGNLIAQGGESARAGFQMVQQDLGYLDSYGTQSDQEDLSEYIHYLGLGIDAGMPQQANVGVMICRRDAEPWYLRIFNANHAYLWDRANGTNCSRRDSSYGMFGQGTFGPDDMGPSSGSECRYIPGSSGREGEIMGYCSEHANDYVNMPFVTDCFSQNGRAIDSAGCHDPSEFFDDRFGD